MLRWVRVLMVVGTMLRTGGCGAHPPVEPWAAEYESFLTEQYGDVADPAEIIEARTADGRSVLVALDERGMPTFVGWQRDRADQSAGYGWTVTLYHMAARSYR